jgi:hypothetical protein
MTTVEFITTLFCQVADQMPDIPKHPHASLWPSEVVTLELLHALKGVGNRAFYQPNASGFVSLSMADFSL